MRSEPRQLTIAEVVTTLGVHPFRVFQAVLNGHLRADIAPDGAVTFPASDVAWWTRRLREDELDPLRG